MSSVQSIFEIGKRALMAQRTVMNVIAHNIANANTPGYSRQRVRLKATDPLRAPYGKIGTGVEVAGIERARDRFVDMQLRAEQPSLARWTLEEQALHQVEDVLGEPSEEGLSALLDQFWNSWQELANQPESPAARISVQQRGMALARGFNRVGTQLSDLRRNLDQQVQEDVAEVNRLAHAIADLNVHITNIEAGGHAANDERDQRDVFLDRLSELVGIRYTEAADGSLTIALGGHILVDRNTVSELTTVARSSNNMSVTEVIWSDGRTSANLTNGELAGLLEVRDEKIVAYLGQLDTLALGIVSEVNAIHRAGYGLNGSTDVDFFDSRLSGAKDMAVSSVIQADVNMIAASQDGSPGDNSNALAMADLRDGRTMDGEQLSFGEYYGSLVHVIGSESQEAAFAKESYDMLVQRLKNERLSVSGVSLDEESALLIQYQQAYEAAARVITAADEMMQTVLNMM